MRFILSTLCTSSLAQRICLWHCPILNRGDCRRMNRSIDGSEIIVNEDNHFRLPVGRDEEEGGVKNHFLSPHSRGPISRLDCKQSGLISNQHNSTYLPDMGGIRNRFAFHPIFLADFGFIKDRLILWQFARYYRL